MQRPSQPAPSLPVVVEEIPPHRFVDADILMAELAGEDADYRLVASAAGTGATISR